MDVYSLSRMSPNDLIGSNNRDQHLGWFYVQLFGQATVRPRDGPDTWQAYQVPAGVGSVALEVVGVGNDPLTDFFYQVATSGMYLTRVG
jgi:hypothetical protein